MAWEAKVHTASVSPMSEAQSTNQTLIERTAYASLAVAVLVMAFKYVAYHVTGSVALYSDALESIANILTAFAALAAIRFSASPADSRHPFGHHKAEYFAAVFEGVLIIVAALVVLDAAWDALQKPRQIKQPTLGLAINMGAAAINMAWAWFLISRGTLWRSPALHADGWHLVADVVTSVGVVIGLVIATTSGLSILDPLLAAIVALNILWQGYHIVRRSLSSLLDEAVPAEIAGKIRDAIRAHGDGAIEAHDIRTREAGRTTFVEFHLVVPGAMTVEAAHAICDRLEAAISKAVDGARTVIHVEPENKAKTHNVDNAVRF
jgi:cation diffusion facilitator family transporter